jgi:hypothetical protein
MAIKTQGTNLYTIDPDDGTVIEAGCVTSIDGIDTTLEQIETTCLNATSRTYIAGLATPGTATFGINFDTADSSHIRLLELKQAGISLPWAIGLSQDPDTPPSSNTDSNGDWVFAEPLPTTRGWILFEGFMNSFPFSFAQNSVVQSTVGIQVSGEVEAVPAGS